MNWAIHTAGGVHKLRDPCSSIPTCTGLFKCNTKKKHVIRQDLSSVVIWKGSKICKIVTQYLHFLTCFLVDLYTFFIALFFASEQTPCTVIVCDWTGDCSFTQHIVNTVHSGVLTALFWLLHCRCQGKLLLSWHTFCVHHTPVYSATFFEAT